MARLDFIIPDDLEKKLRLKAVEKFGGRKGSLKDACIEALKQYCDKK